MLTDTGYRVVRRLTPNRDYPPGHRRRAEPAGRTVSTAGTVVTLDVANGPPETTTVPTVLGLLSDEANAAATRARARAPYRRRAEPPPGSPARAGRVWKQSPVAGTKVDEGAR